MAEKNYTDEFRIERVRAMAARIVGLCQGESMREAMHALALAAGTLIKNCYRGVGRDVALLQHIANLKEHSKND